MSTMILNLTISGGRNTIVTMANVTAIEPDPDFPREQSLIHFVSGDTISVSMTVDDIWNLIP